MWYEYGRTYAVVLEQRLAGLEAPLCVDVAAEEPEHEEEEQAAQDGPFYYHAFLRRVSCVGPIVESRKCMDVPQCTRIHSRGNTQSSRRHTRRNTSLSRPY